MSTKINVKDIINNDITNGIGNQPATLCDVCRELKSINEFSLYKHMSMRHICLECAEWLCILEEEEAAEAQAKLK